MGDGVQRRQHEHRRVARARPHLLNHAPAVEHGQHNVENHEAVLARKRCLQAVFAIVANVDNETLLAQALFQEPGRFRIVFDHEQLHTPARPPDTAKLPCGARKPLNPIAVSLAGGAKAALFAGWLRLGGGGDDGI